MNAIIQSCVKMFLLSCETFLQSIVEMAEWQAEAGLISVAPLIPQKCRQDFLHVSVQRSGTLLGQAMSHYSKNACGKISIIVLQGARYVPKFREVNSFCLFRCNNNSTVF